MTRLQVCAAVLLHRDRLLLATRPPGGHLEGRWEFPGGKRREGESSGACIRRELTEELQLRVRPLGTVSTLAYDYPGKQLDLHFVGCRLAGDSPALHPTEGQRAGWFSPDQLRALQLAPADARFVDLARTGALPEPSGMTGAGPVWPEGRCTLQHWLTLDRGSVHTQAGFTVR